MNQLIELLTRILCDTPPPTIADGAFLFGQTPDNQESVLKRACQLMNTHATCRLLFAKTPPISGYPGYEAWKTELLLQGITDEQIIGVPVKEKTILHTLIEAESAVGFAREQKMQSLYIIAAPFQQLRGYMTAVTATLRMYPQLKLYSVPGYPLPWLQEVVHSQGKEKGQRASLIAGELQRISIYQQKGDLASAESVLTYLDNRDNT